MEFKISKTPKQYGRNGNIITGAGGRTYSYYSSSSTGGATITNYLPSYFSVENNRYDVVDNIAFFCNSGMWEFFKRETTTQQTTNENGETINETINNDTLVLKIEPNTIKFGDGSEVITTKHFQIDGNNLITDYNIISKGEITAFGVGNISGGDGNNGGTSTITNIVDNLTSTSTTDALSANQGRILNEKINSANHSHSNKSVIDGITSSMVSEWNRSVGSIHTHTNKSVIDTITSNNITNWNSAFANNHTHATNKNCDVYRLFVGNYGGIRSAETNNDILKFGDSDITLNSNGRNLYLGGSNTQTVYIPTYFDNGDGTTTAQWNSFTGTQFYMQMPMRIALQSHNNTQPPIWTNSNVLCPSLNADLLDGCHSSSFVTNVGTNGDIITVTKGGNTTTSIKPNFATKALRLVNEKNETYCSYYDTYVNLTGTGGNINIGAQQYKNNNYSIQFITNNGTADTTGTVFWNSINGNRFLTQVPYRINLQSGINDNEPPISVNTTTMCPNLNANYLGGYKESDFVKKNGNVEINGDVKINGSLTVSDEITAFATSLNQSLTSKIKSALQNVESATTIDEIKSILITLKNSI